MSIQAFLGVDNLQGKNGSVPVSTLEGKTVLLYFSAHWCPPCKQFTPKLCTFYEKMKAAKKHEFEIIYVSGDKDQGQFDGYYADMPFLALPFEKRAEKNKLNGRLGVSGIPTLVALDKDANVITTKARNNVMSDPQGKNFPWTPKSIEQIFAGGDILTHDGKNITVADLKAFDGFAVYFSAHWCGPCRSFTPKLIEAYKKNKAAGKKLEVIFATADRAEEDFESYWGEQPWAALPYEDERIQELSEALEVEGYPTLITFGSDFSVINKDAVGNAASDVEGNDFPWAKKPLEVACALNPETDGVVDALNGNACVIFNSNGAADKDAARAAFTAAAKAFDAKENAKREASEKIRFFTVEPGNNVYERVLQMLGTPQPKAGNAVLFSFKLQAKQGKFVEGDVTEAAVTGAAELF